MLCMHVREAKSGLTNPRTFHLEYSSVEKIELLMLLRLEDSALGSCVSAKGNSNNLLCLHLEVPCLLF